MPHGSSLRRTGRVGAVLLSMWALGGQPAHGQAAAPDGAPGSPARTDTLYLGNAGEPETLDPHRYNLRLEETLLTDLFLGLTTFDAAANVVPGAAERWTVSDDGLVWTFTLRDGLKWSDGAALTAADFVFAFQRLLDPATAASLAYFMYPLRNAEAVNAGRAPAAELGARAIDPRTLELTLERPYPYLPERLLYPTGYPVPRHVIERVGDDWVKPRHWVSNGAYRLADWQPQAAITLERNPHFAASGLPAAHLPTVVYLPLAGDQAAYNRYRAGEVDAISTFPASELPAVRDRLPEHLRLSPLLSITYLVFNTRQPPFDDPRVRQALALAVQRETLTDKVQRAGNVASASFVPALVNDYQPVPEPAAAQSQEERLGHARALLADAGYGPGKPLSITLRYVSSTEAKRTNLAIAAFWKALGVDTRLHQAELKVHFSDLRQGNFQVAMAGWFGESNPEHYLGLWQSDTGDVNYGGYRNPAFDALMGRAAQQSDLTARNTLLRDAEAVGIADYPVVPLYAVMVRRLVRPDLAGWQDNARDAHPARFLHWR